jgi:hypothetical protein
MHPKSLKILVRIRNRSRIRLVRGTDPRIQIRIKMPRIPNTNLFNH